MVFCIFQWDFITIEVAYSANLFYWFQKLLHAAGIELWSPLETILQIECSPFELAGPNF